MAWNTHNDVRILCLITRTSKVFWDTCPLLQFLLSPKIVQMFSRLRQTPKNSFRGNLHLPELENHGSTRVESQRKRFLLIPLNWNLANLNISCFEVFFRVTLLKIADYYTKKSVLVFNSSEILDLHSAIWR